jgi:hypothetical protein
MGCRIYIQINTNIQVSVVIDIGKKDKIFQIKSTTMRVGTNEIIVLMQIE